MSNITLKGMTWKHPRGFDPLFACSKAWKEKTGITVEWVQRSLQDFESYPVEDLARTYDLIIIDHPHVGQIANENCLVQLDIVGREAESKALAKASVGPSYASYNWQGRQWALPVDAAAAVQAFRPDILQSAPKHWKEVITLAREGRVLLPLKPPHNLMVYFTLAGNLGTPCGTNEGDNLIDVEYGSAVFELLQEIAGLVPPDCFGMDPIAVYERMSEPSSVFVCAPMQMAYVSYSKAGFRPKHLKFADIPIAGTNGPRGSALGGTGLAVSAFSNHPKEAIDFAYWIASGDVQKGLYAASGGQAGHTDAWEEDTVNDSTADFYRGTRATYNAGWVRPRHDGYMAFQQAASDRINAGLVARESPANVVNDLNRLFRGSFAAR